MSPLAPFQWIDISAPRAVIREPASDGLEIRVRAMTLPIPGYGHFAKADVITITHGIEMRHENVLLAGDEARTSRVSSMPHSRDHVATAVRVCSTTG